MRRALLLVVAVALVVVGAAFVADRLAEEWEASKDALGSASAGWLALAVVLAAAGMVAVASGWQAVLALVGARLPLARLVPWYFAGEITKYVPGLVWPVIGRAELARRGGVPRPAAYASVALSLAFWYAAAAAVATTLEPWLALLVPVGLALLHPAVTGPVVALGERVLKRPLLVVPSWPQAVALVARYAAAWLLLGSATWAVARALDPGADWLLVLGATAFSWLVGFLAVPAPGGVGVREAAFVAAASAMPPGIAASTAVVARLVFVGVDSAGALLLARAAGRREALR